MKRSIITIILALAAGLSASAQGMYDGLTYSENNYVGTARTLAMGNAFTALGGDLGAVGINPAALAVSRYYQFSISPGFNTSISVAQGTTPDGATAPTSFGTSIRSTRTKMSFPNFGMSMVYDLSKSSAVKRVTLGMVSNSTDYFLQDTYAQGNHYGTSFAGYLATNTNAPYSGLAAKDAYTLGYYNWDAIMGVQSGMVSNISGTNNEYVGVTEKYTIDGSGNTNIYVPGTLEQNYGRSNYGSKSDFVMNLGLDINDWIYVGANLGFNYFKYGSDWYIRETAQDPKDFDIQFRNDDGTTTTAYFNTLKYQYFFAAKGSGIYGKLGIIMTPGKHLRVGATIQTPTYTTIDESWQVAGETNFDGAGSKYNSESISPDGTQRYILHGPWRAGLGVASTFGKNAVISADYEATFYNRMRYGYSNNETSEYFTNVNYDIRECMGVQHNIRVGAEYKIASFVALRAGYTMISSPINKSYDQFGRLVRLSPSLKHSGSAGVGFAFGSFNWDMALRTLFYDTEYIKPYSDYIVDYDSNQVIVASPEIHNWHMLLSGVMTFGFKF